MEVVMSPEVFVDRIEEVMPRLTRDERVWLQDYCWVWAVVSYENDIPESLVQKLNRLDVQCLS